MNHFKRVLAGAAATAVAAGALVVGLGVPAEAAGCSSLLPTVNAQVSRFGSLVRTTGVGDESARYARADVLADPASTRPQKLLAEADYIDAHTEWGLAKGALSAAKADAARLRRCDSGAVSSVSVRASQRVGAYNLGIARALRLQYRVHLAQHIVIRDNFKHWGSEYRGQYRNYVLVVEADRAALDSLETTIANLG